MDEVGVIFPPVISWTFIRMNEPCSPSNTHPVIRTGMLSLAARMPAETSDTATMRRICFIHIPLEADVAASSTPRRTAESGVCARTLPTRGLGELHGHLNLEQLVGPQHRSRVGMGHPRAVLRGVLAHVHPLGRLLRRHPLRPERRRLAPEVAQVALE